MAPNILTKAIHASEEVAERVPDMSRVKTSLEDGMRGARRAVRHGRYVAEELMEDAIHSMRRHPVQTAAISFGLGFAAGISLGFMICRAKR